MLDDLRTARGIILGFLISLVFWIVLLEIYTWATRYFFR